MFKLWFWGNRVLAALYRRTAAHVAIRLHRASLASVGPRTRIQAGVRFDRPSQVTIGADCFIWSGVGASAEGAEPKLTIGDRVQINRFAHLDMTGGLTIGDDTLISEDATISTHDHGLDPRSPAIPVPKVIGPGVWIGMRAIVLPSCRVIGAHAVIGAGAVVTHDVPARAIMAGNPARIIGQRKPQEAAA